MSVLHGRYVPGRPQDVTGRDDMKTSRRLVMGGVALATAAALAIGGGAVAFAHDGGGKYRGERGGVLSSLVTDGTLTQTQVDAIKETLHAGREENRAARQAERQAARDAALSSLVASGTLTQAQADAVASAIDAAHSQRGEGPRSKRGMHSPRG